MVLKKVGRKFLPTTESGRALRKKPTTKKKAQEQLAAIEISKRKRGKK